MTRAEKAEFAKKCEAERGETQRIIAEAQVLRAQREIAQPKGVKTFEIDGEQVPYETPKGADYGKDKTISNGWLAIIKAKKEAGL